MKFKILTLLVLVNVFRLDLYGQDVNVLEGLNGNFELGSIDHWRFVEVNSSDWLSSAEVTDVEPNEGVWTAKVTWAVDDAISDLVFDQRPAILPQEIYTYRAIAKSLTGACMLRMHATFYDSNQNILSDVNDPSWILTGDYSEHIWELPLSPVGTSFVQIGFRVFDANGSRWPASAMTTLIDDVRLIGRSTSLSPRVMTTSIVTDDVPVASIDVTEAPYNASKDGSVDATFAFQSAIDRVYTAGGGVLFVPSGTYRFGGSLNIPEGVIIRGEWANPESGGVQGTVLMPYANKGNEDATPFISLNIGAGVKNLSIWYPEQSVASISPYPWTIHCHPNANKGIDNTSVINVTLVNSYNGIKIGPEANELHYIRNVYGTPLNQGIWLSQTTDIGRIQNVHFEPRFWNESGLVGAPAVDEILNWLQNNATTGLTMGRADWEYVYDISLIGYQTGVQLIKYSDAGPDGVIYGLRIEKSKIGIDFVDVNPIGWAITNSDISVEGINSACVRAGDSFSSVAQFNSCTFGGNPTNIIKFSSGSTGRMTFQNCIFENWGQAEALAAIECNQGTIALLGNTFKLDQLHLSLGRNVVSALVLDNSFPTDLKLKNESTGEVIISQEPLNMGKLDIPAHPYADEPRPVNDILFDVMDYGAKLDGITDNTLAFQAALDDAALNGGGTVYVPAGMFRIDGHLSVWTGVELRGIWDVPHHTTSKGSVLMAYEGKDDSSGAPFISLGSGAGMRGLTVWYPEQNTQNFHPYPWSIQALGDNCWIKDVTLANTYQGVDLKTNSSTGHRVSYLAGAPLMTGIAVDNNLGDGWIENVQFNPHYWQRSIGYPQTEVPDINTIISYQQANLEAVKIGSAVQEHVLGTFVFAAHKGIHLMSDNGNSNIDIYMHGTDAGSNGVYLESAAGSKINFVNTQLVLLGINQNGIITTSSGFGAKASFYNSISWGGEGATVKQEGGGEVLIQQLHTLNGTLNLINGYSRLENISISSNLTTQYNIGNEVSQFRLFGSYSENNFSIVNQSSDKSKVEYDYYNNNNLKSNALVSGWESDDASSIWDKTLFGNKDFDIENNNSFQCQAISTEIAHAGLNALSIIGDKIVDETLYYKIFDSKILIAPNSTLTYWLNPTNETGRTGHIDVLFSDDTRLTELSQQAEDGLLLEDPRGAIGEWVEVQFPIGKYAEGKSIQSVLVGAVQTSTEEFNFLIDDIQLGDFTLSIDDDLLDQSVSYFPNPATDFISILSDIPLTRVEIISISGKKVMEVNSQFKSISLHQLSSGNLYFLKIYSEKGLVVKKILKI